VKERISKDDLKHKLRSIKRIIDNPAAPEGEKAAAQAALERLMQAYDIQPDDLAEMVSEAKPRVFYYQDDYERSLLIQLNGLVCNKSRVSYSAMKATAKGKRISFTLNEVQYREMKALCDTYLPALRDELRTLVSAFFQKHDLFPQSATSEKSDGLDKDALRNALAMRRLRHVTRPTEQLPEVI
jgi:hypothetical protein